MVLDRSVHGQVHGGTRSQIQAAGGGSRGDPRLQRKRATSPGIRPKCNALFRNLGKDSKAEDHDRGESSTMSVHYSSMSYTIDGCQDMNNSSEIDSGNTSRRPGVAGSGVARLEDTDILECETNLGNGRADWRIASHGSFIMDPFRKNFPPAINATLPPACDRIISFSERTPTILTTNARK